MCLSTAEPRNPADPAPQQVDVATLYRDHHPVMRRVARAVLDGRDAQADEAVARVIQDLGAAHRAGRLTPRDSWEAYLVVAVRRAALRVGARESHVRAHEVSRDDDRSTTSDSGSAGGAGGTTRDVADADAEHRLDLVADRQILYAGLAKLSDRRRTIVVQRFAQGASRAEIAQALGITEQAVGNNERSALDQLREEWADDERPS